MRKKGSTYMFGELFQLILGVIILIFVFSFFGKFAYNFFVSKSMEPSLKSFDVLVEEIRSLKDQENKTVPIFTKLDDMKGLMIIGFEAGDGWVSGKCFDKSTKESFLVLDKLLKPMKQCGTGGCLCLYKVIYSSNKVFVSNLDIIKCEGVDFSLEGGKSTLVWGKGNNVPYWGGVKGQSGITPDDAFLEKEREIICDYAVVPSFGNLRIIGLQRQQKSASFCLGIDCSKQTSCGKLDSFNCGVYKGVCYPKFGLQDNFISCEHCPDSGFDCGSIGSPCPDGECKAACNRDHCDGDCFWKKDPVNGKGACVDSSTLNPWEMLDNWRDCIDSHYYPFFKGKKFQQCQECPDPRYFDCGKIKSNNIYTFNFYGILEDTVQTICEADICSLDCRWDGKCVKAS